MTEHTLSLELRYLLYTCLWMLVIWVPYILAQVIGSRGKAFTYPDEGVNMPVWCERWKKAHYNLVENIVPFAASVIAAEFIGLHTSTTAACAVIYFWARVAHPFAQALRIPLTRTAVYFVGWAATIMYLFAILKTAI